MGEINNSMFDHFLITRFNLKNNDWNVDKNDNVICDKDWLNFRFDIFEKTCFNSIKNQNNLNFKWLVYYDIETPNNFKKHIESLNNDFPQFIPIYKESNQIFLNDLSKDIKRFSNNKEYIITTRIDNDDAFHYQAIEKIQEQFNYQDSTIINLPWIVCFDLINKRMSKHFYVSNPFISLIDKNNNGSFQTVFVKQHNDWRKSHEIVNINDNKAYCFQLIHERNIYNEMVGELFYDKEIKKQFNLLIDIKTGVLYPFYVAVSKLKIVGKKTIKFIHRVLRKILKFK